ncbi:MAG: TIM barrel protein [Oscillospiraceae bacterium]|jgi:deoxyribonuclease-4|nr:TIM barrel protein [Oscillospiraceae bacterium]
MNALFGPAGMSDDAAANKIKTTEQLLSYLSEKGVDLFEYQCGRGVNVGAEKCAAIGKRAKEEGITLSLHAPYFISLASAEEEKRDNSIRYILQSARAASAMGAERIVVHPGGIGKYSREEATAIACDTLRRAVATLDGEGLSHIVMCPEVMGKINQLGDVDEVISFCELDERMIPCVDFGHLNSRTHGGIKIEDDCRAVFEKIRNKLGEERGRAVHIHFSKIEYSKGGEVRHLTFEDSSFGPDFTVLMKCIARDRLHPHIICESAGTQTADALDMKRCYKKFKSSFERKDERKDVQNNENTDN